MNYRLLIPALFFIFSCHKNSGNTNNNAIPGGLPGTLTISGDPAAPNGTRWTYTETGAINYNLEGVLYKPAGIGPFPAIVINHGTGGNANSYSNSIAKKMVGWGYVTIAANYTHSAGVNCGSPGSCIESDGEWGASNSNLLRAMKTRQVLVSLSYVDSLKLAAFGHSRGAFITTGLAGYYPGSFKVFGHTAGGINSSTVEPTAATAMRITKPYVMHHGDMDNTVPIARDYALRDLLNSRSVTNTLYVYPGYSHSQISNDSLMFERTKQWFQLHLD